jgi:hypothetical protein
MTNNLFLLPWREKVGVEGARMRGVLASPSSVVCADTAPSSVSLCRLPSLTRGEGS